MSRTLDLVLIAGLIAWIIYRIVWRFIAKDTPRREPAGRMPKPAPRRLDQEMVFNSNTFEHDYIAQVLKHLVVELKTSRPEYEVIDKYAVQLTSFMAGQIHQAVKTEVTPHNRKEHA